MNLRKKLNGYNYGIHTQYHRFPLLSIQKFGDIKSTKIIRMLKIFLIESRVLGCGDLLGVI